MRPNRSPVPTADEASFLRSKFLNPLLAFDEPIAIADSVMVYSVAAFGKYRDPLQGRLFTTFRMTTLQECEIVFPRGSK